MPSIETFSTLFPILLSLFLFGLWFDGYVGKEESQGRDVGKTWIYVVFGVALTQIGVGVIDLFVNLNAGLLGFLCYSCSGTPMILGAIRRNDALQKQLADTMRKVTDRSFELGALCANVIWRKNASRS